MTSSHLEMELSAIAKRYGLVDVYAFGSRAKEITARMRGQTPSETRPKSDVDIGVRPRRGVDLGVDEKVGLSLALSDLFGVTRVDLVDVTKASAFLALDIISGELLYTVDLDDQAEYELYVMRRAGDLAYFERERRRMILDEGAR